MNKWCVNLVAIFLVSILSAVVTYGQTYPKDIYLPFSSRLYDFSLNEMLKGADLHDLLGQKNYTTLLQDISSKDSQYIFNIIHQFILNKTDTVAYNALMKVEIKNGKKVFYIDLNSLEKYNCCEHVEFLFAKKYLSITYDKYFHALAMQPKVNNINNQEIDLYLKKPPSDTIDIWYHNDKNQNSIFRQTVHLSYYKEDISKYQINYIYQEMPVYQNMVIRKGLYKRPKQKSIYRYIYRTCLVENIDVQEMVVLYNISDVIDKPAIKDHNWYKVPKSMYEYSAVFSIENTDKPTAKRTSISLARFGSE